METFFINTKNSKTSESNKFVYNLTDKLNLKNPNKTMALANLSIYYTWKNIKKGYSNHKFKISIARIQDYFEYIIKQHETITNNSFPIPIYPIYYHRHQHQ